MMSPAPTLFTGGIGSRHSGLDLWLPFDEASGTQNDLSGNSFSTSIVGATQGVSAGNLGLACNFDGVNDYISATDASLLSSYAGNTVATISFWAAASAYTAGACAFSISEDNTNDSLAIYPYFAGGMGAQQIRVWYNGQYTMQFANTLVADGAYHHFCYVQRSTTVHELYIDGVLVGTSAVSKTISSDIDAIVVGNYDVSSNEPYVGEITNVKLSSRGWSTQEITRDFKYP